MVPYISGLFAAAIRILTATAGPPVRLFRSVRAMRAPRPMATLHVPIFWAAVLLKEVLRAFCAPHRLCLHIDVPSRSGPAPGRVRGPTPPNRDRASGPGPVLRPGVSLRSVPESIVVHAADMASALHIMTEGFHLATRTLRVAVA